MTLPMINLTPREIQVLQMIANEYSSNEIANALYVSHHTILTHRKNLLDKLSVRNTAGLVRKGFETGYLKLAKRMVS